MAIPHFNPKKISTSPEQVLANHFNVKFYDGEGIEIENVYASIINITERDGLNTFTPGCEKNMSLTISSNTEFIANFGNISTIKYCYFYIYDRYGKSLSDKIFKIDLTSVQSKFDYSMDTSFQENDCEFTITEEHDITSKKISADDAIKTILRGKKIDDILEN